MHKDSERDALFVRAFTLHQDGHGEAARDLYLEVLRLVPSDPDANHNLGILETQAGNRHNGIRYLKRAVAAAPGKEVYRLNLCLALLEDGEFRQARACLQHGIRLGLHGEAVERMQARISASIAADDADRAARQKRGARAGTATPAAFLAAGLFAQAAHAARRLLDASPGRADLWSVLGKALMAQDHVRDALPALERACSLSPKDSGGWLALALCQARSGDPRAEHSLTQVQRPGVEHMDALASIVQAAIASDLLDTAAVAARIASSLDPSDSGLRNNLAAIYGMLGRHEDALEILLDLERRRPGDFDIQQNLGNAFNAVGRFDEALACYARARSIAPRSFEPYMGAVRPYTSTGRYEDALDGLRHASELAPGNQAIMDTLLFALNYHPTETPESIFESYRCYEQEIARQCSGPVGSPRLRPDRQCLRVGYVSPDFRRHSMRHFLAPVIERHDRSRFEIFAYAELEREDRFSDWFKSRVDHWTNTVSLTDAELRHRIDEDDIDILVDLAGHTDGNRLPVFAMRPARIRLSWLGYGYTTGLSAIDWILMDEIMAPTGWDHIFAERLWRIGRCSIVYRPPEDIGSVGPSPAEINGYVTFGSMSRTIRLNERVLDVWAAILQALPNSRLALNNPDLGFECVKEMFRQRFAARGISVNRLILGCDSPPWDAYRDLDITLDCFPHNSGTTLFESAYLGVPFLTLADRPSVGRIGASIASGLGHPEWVAVSEEDYFNKAVALASDLSALVRLRESLRSEMERSPLMDEEGFARRLESTYQEMWILWNAEHGSEGPS